MMQLVQVHSLFDNTDFFGGILDFMYNIQFKFFGYTINFNDMSGTIESMCNWSNLASKTSDLYNIISPVNSVLVSVGLDLLALFTIINLVKRAMDVQQISWEKIVMEIIKFFIFKWLIENSFSFGIMIMNVANNSYSSILSAVNGVISSSSANLTISQYLSNAVGKGLGSIGGGMITIALWIPYLASAMGIFIQVASVLIKIIVSLAVSPIPLSLGADESGQHTARSFIMSIIGYGVELWLLVLESKIYNLCLAQLTQSCTDTSALSSLIGLMIGVIFANSLFTAVMGWTDTKVQSLVGGN